MSTSGSAPSAPAPSPGAPATQRKGHHASTPTGAADSTTHTLSGASHSHYGTRGGAHPAPHAGLVDPGWTRLALACLIPCLLALTAPLPTWSRLALIVILVPLTAQGWPALVRAHHNARITAVMNLCGIGATIAVGITHDFGSAGIVMALSVLAAFIAQMLRRDRRDGLLEDVAATVTGNLIVVCGAGWCTLETGTADPAVIVPCAMALFIGAALTVVDSPARTLEALTVSIPALCAGVAGGVLAAVGFFGPGHTGTTAALQSAGACLMCGFVAGILMAASNRVLWTHRWVPGGRAAVASAIVPIMAVGAPVYAIARLMGSFVAG